MRRLVWFVAAIASVLASTVGVAPRAGADQADRVDAFGLLADHGAPDNAVPVAMRSHPEGGYWVVTADGGVHTYGGAPFHGAAAGQPLAAPVVGLDTAPGGGGYWLAAADGGVLTFGSARFLGSAVPFRPSGAVVGIAATPKGDGYWLATADGGVFAFGTAPFLGSAADRPLAAPIVGIASTPNGDGYWLVAADGGVLTFGAAPFVGSAGDQRLVAPVVGMAATPSGGGYWLVAADGGVLTFGDAPFLGRGTESDEPVVGIDGAGGAYRVVRGRTASPPVPPSGTGRRIVYGNGAQRVWLVGASERVEHTYLVSGKLGVPAPGTYRVYSKSPVAYAGHHGITMELMVRFTHSPRSGIPIGFHDIPRDRDGREMQTEDDLGGFRSAGCVRQSDPDARFLWDWAPVGTTVVVLP